MDISLLNMHHQRIEYLGLVDVRMVSEGVGSFIEP